MKLVYYVVVFVALLKATASDNLKEGNVFPDYWQDDYDNFYDYGDLEKEVSKEKQETDKKVDAEIQDFIENNAEEKESFSNEEFDALRDYQIEDNRSNTDSKENDNAYDDALEKQLDVAPADSPNNSAVDPDPEVAKSIPGEVDPVPAVIEPVPEVAEAAPERADSEPKVIKPEPEEVILDPKAVQQESEAVVPKPEEDLPDSNENLYVDDYDDWWNNFLEGKDDIFPDFNENIESSEEVQKPNEENKQSKEESYVNLDDTGNVDPDLDEIIKETNDNQQDNDQSDSNIDDNKNDNEDVEGINYDNDTPEKVLEDLSDDLDKLFETLDKLSENDSDVGNNNDLTNNNENVDDIQDYEEKYKRPYGEGYIMSLRDDYDNFSFNNLTENSEVNADKPLRETELEEDVAEDDYAEVENNEKVETTKAKLEEEKADAPVSNDDKLSDDALESFDESEDSVFDDEIKKHYYGNDGLVDDALTNNEDAEVFSQLSATNIPEQVSVTTSTVELSTAADEEINEDPTTVEEPEELVTSERMVEKATSVLAEVPEESYTPNNVVGDESVTTTEDSVYVDDLTSTDYKYLMARFAQEHKDEILDSNSLLRNTDTPIHVTLSVDEPTVITSPNYPNNYPTGTLVEWVVDGPGRGIEMNLTDCRINGNVGDYLLVIPGGSNGNSSDGILFSFQLRSERRYRFMNVNRMFVRFQSHDSMLSLPGFSLSARLIWPPVETQADEEPEQSELVIHPPTETLDLSLAGLTLVQFRQIRAEFKQLIADMAQLYIEDNNIDPGLNTTLEVTQITRTAICNIRWPSYETCVEVTFGVPLHYAEPVEKPRLNTTELKSMWRTYIAQEPFAARLREFGITEYAIPDDHSILTLWLVIAGGVVIAMCLLGFALWRFNCFVDYTRMKAFSDSDSIHNEKRNLDLYPTPHQTLPPLYSESDYKWADGKYDDSSRVDMGGFANKSYIRDDFFEFDSDEDVIVPRDRKNVISPRDIYEV